MVSNMETAMEEDGDPESEMFVALSFVVGCAKDAVHLREARAATKAGYSEVGGETQEEEKQRRALLGDDEMGRWLENGMTVVGMHDHLSRMGFAASQTGLGHYLSSMDLEELQKHTAALPQQQLLGEAPTERTAANSQTQVLEFLRALARCCVDRALESPATADGHHCSICLQEQDEEEGLACGYCSADVCVDCSSNCGVCNEGPFCSG